MLPVDALGLAAFVEPQPQQHRVGAHGKLAGAGREPKATAAMAPVARLEADDGNALVPERIEAAVEPRRLYARAARALIARPHGKVADHRDARSRPERQHAVLVFQQHGAFLGKPRGKVVVLVHIAVGRAPEGLLRVVDKAQYARYALVEQSGAHAL